MSFCDNVAVTSTQLETLVRLFGPSKFQLELRKTSKCTGKLKDDAEEKEEAIALHILHVQQRETEAGNLGNNLHNKVCSSKQLLEVALSTLREDLREPVRRAADIIKGRMMTPGVVRELENIRVSPSGSTCKAMYRLDF